MRTSIILFLNKVDLFKQKLARSPLSNYFPDYSGGNDVNRAAKYLLWRFNQVNRAHLNLYPQYVICDRRPYFLANFLQSYTSHRYLEHPSRFCRRQRNDPAQCAQRFWHIINELSFSTLPPSDTSIILLTLWLDSSNKLLLAIKRSLLIFDFDTTTFRTTASLYQAFSSISQQATAYRIYSTPFRIILAPRRTCDEPSAIPRLPTKPLSQRMQHFTHTPPIHQPSQ
jgi:hypothetical protein